MNRLTEALLRPRNARLAALALAGVVVALTTWPFDFTLAPATLAARWREVEWTLLYRDRHGALIVDADLVLNVFFLVPLGAAIALARTHDSVARAGLAAFALGAALSTFVEALQILIPERSPQLADIARNALGCAAGGLAAAAIRRRLAPPGPPP